MIKYILKNYYKQIIYIAIFSLLGAYFSLLLPEYLASIISEGIATFNKTLIYDIGLKLIIISFLVFIFAILTSFFSNRLGAKIGLDLRSKLYKATLNLDLCDVNKFGISSLIVRNTADINEIENMISILTKSIIYSIVLGIGGIIKAIIIGRNIKLLTTIIIICVLITMISLYIIFIIVAPKYVKLQTNLDKINDRFQEVLNGLLIIKAHNQEEYEYKKSERFNKNYIDLEYFLNKIMSTLAPFVNMILSFSSIAIVFIMFKNAFNLNDVANMIAFSEYASQVINSFLSLTMSFIMLPKAKTSFIRIFEIINSYNSIYDIPKPKELKNINNLTLNNVTFSYPGCNEPILKNINLNLNKGETIVIIGSTGSGKSTLVHLLNRFYDVNDGEILINNIDIRKIKMKNLFENIATVFQNEFLMRGNIKDIMFNNNLNEINKIYKITELKNFDLEKIISFNGENLSGGQKQRIAIARALLKNPNLLILDDSFSQMDYSTEKNIMTNIKNAYPNLTKIIISSRISSIKYADKIIVIDNGEIVGVGNHKELIRNCNIYKIIYNLANDLEAKNG